MQGAPPGQAAQATPFAPQAEEVDPDSQWPVALQHPRQVEQSEPG
jgi:hypothetical protein